MSASPRPRVRGHAPQPANHEGLARFLRQLHPFDTAGNVEADSGIKAATVSNWLQGRNRISVDALWALVKAYGPDVLIALCPGDVPAWMDDQAIAKEEAELAARSAVLAERRAALEARR